MALDWKNDPTTPQPTDAELEELAAGISDMRYGGTSAAGAEPLAPAADADDTADLSAAAPGVAASASSTNDADEPQLSSLNFILGGEESPAEEPEPAATPAPAPAPTPASAQEPEPPAAPAPAPAPASQPAVTIPEPVSAIPGSGPSTPEPAEIPHPTEAEPPKEKKSLLARLNEPIDRDKAAAGLKSALTKRGGGGWPTKTSINLYVKSERELNPRRIILVSVLAAAAIVVFLKFGVFDQFARVTAKELEHADYQTQLVTLQSQLTDYDEVREEYEAYNVQTSSTDIDVLGALDMVDRVVRPVATVVAEQVDENTLTLTLSGASLDTYGNLVVALSAETQVSGVSIRTADNTSADSTSNVTATLTVTLRTITEVTMIEEGLAAVETSTEEDSGSAVGDYVSQTVNNVVEFGSTPDLDVEG